MKLILRSLLLLSGCTVALLAGGCDNHDAAVKKTENKPVVVLKAYAMTLHDQVEALGTAEAREAVSITARLAGRLEEVSFHDGQFVHKGDVIARMDQDEEQAQLVAATVQMAEHQREIKRLGLLLARKAAATRDLDERKTLAAVTASSIAQIRARIAELTLTAPFDGKLGIRRVSPGALIQPGTLITTLDAADAINVDFTIPSTSLMGLAAGAAIQATTDARAGELFTGTLTVIDSRIDPLTRSILLRARIDNTDGRLIPGMLMRVVLLEHEREALMVPEESITQRQEAHYLTLVGADGVVEQRVVQSGRRRDGLVEITHGLAAGEQVMVRGMGFVKPGQAVTVSETWERIRESSYPLQNGDQ